MNITYQQLQKYEKGINRISASRLYKIALELKIPVNYFYQDLDLIAQSTSSIDTKNVLSARLSVIEFMSTDVALNLCRFFAGIKNPYVKESILNLVTSLSSRDAGLGASPEVPRK